MPNVNGWCETQCDGAVGPQFERCCETDVNGAVEPDVNGVVKTM